MGVAKITDEAWIETDGVEGQHRARHGNRPGAIYYNRHDLDSVLAARLLQILSPAAMPVPVAGYRLANERVRLHKPVAVVDLQMHATADAEAATALWIGSGRGFLTTAAEVGQLDWDVHYSTSVSALETTIDLMAERHGGGPQLATKLPEHITMAMLLLSWFCTGRFNRLDYRHVYLYKALMYVARQTRPWWHIVESTFASWVCRGLTLENLQLLIREGEAITRWRLDNLPRQPVDASTITFSNHTHRCLSFDEPLDPFDAYALAGNNEAEVIVCPSADDPGWYLVYAFGHARIERIARMLGAGCGRLSTVVDDPDVIREVLKLEVQGARHHDADRNPDHAL